MDKDKQDDDNVTLMKPARFMGEEPILRDQKNKESFCLSYLTQDKAAKRAIAPFLRSIRHVPKPKQVTSDDETITARTKAVSFLVDRQSVLIRSLKTFTTAESINIPGALYETADMMLQVTKSAGVVLYIVDSANGELYQCPRNIRNPRHRVNWKIKLSSTVACHVAQTKKFIWCGDILADSRFPEGVGWSGIGQAIKAVICAPILTPDNEIIAIIELYRGVDAPNYLKSDAQIVISLTAWMGAGIYQNQLRLGLLRQQNLNNRLLEFINAYFSSPTGDDIQIITDMMVFAKNTMAAEHASFFIVDQSSTDLESDWYCQSTENPNELYKRKVKLKFARLRSVAGYVARTGQAINVKDVPDDPRFKDTDKDTNEITRTALCAPVMDNEKVAGILLLSNKKDNGHFNTIDEITFHIFATYSSLAMHHFDIQRKLLKTKCSLDIDREILHHNVKPCSHDVERLKQCKFQVPDEFWDFQWYPLGENLGKMDEYLLSIYQNILGDAFLQKNNLPRFIAAVKKAYRDITYHNFEHAFIVTHGIMNILKRNRDVFTGLEIQAMIIAGVIHDIDHRGFTNAYLHLIEHSLAKLYDSSTLEHHHFYVGSMIIQDCDMFSYLNADIYKKMMGEIEASIMHTDLALHFRCRTRLAGIIADRHFNWPNPDHRFLMKGIIMTSSDLVGQTKTLPVAERLVTNLYTEFYNQGDEEKKMGLTPLPGMDREKVSSIPEDQVKFLNIAVVPCNELLATLLPNTRELLENALKLIDCWQEVIDMKGKRIWRPDESLFVVKNY